MGLKQTRKLAKFNLSCFCTKSKLIMQKIAATPHLSTPPPAPSQSFGEGRKTPKIMKAREGKPILSCGARRHCPTGGNRQRTGFRGFRERLCLKLAQFHRLDSPPRSFGEGLGVGLKQTRKLAKFNLSCFCTKSKLIMQKIAATPHLSTPPRPLSKALGRGERPRKL